MKTLKPYLLPFALLTIFFIALGDKVLPEPLKGASSQSRAAVSQFVMNLMPAPRAKLDPNKRTEEEVKKLENR